MKVLDKLFEKWKQAYIDENKEAWKQAVIDASEAEIEMRKHAMLQTANDAFLQERQDEIIAARDVIIHVLKELGISLPGACFTLDIVKAELVRAQLHEFLGNVKLTDKLPLSSRKPTPIQPPKSR